MRKGLEVAIPSGLNRVGNIELLKVNLASSDSPFAVVDYAVDGKKQELGLRLDVDKQVFLDKTGDPRIDDDLQDRAAELAKYIQRYIQKIEEGAYLMSLMSPGTMDRSVDFWVYAEAHLLTVTRAALAAAQTAEQAAAALDETIKSFDWQQHLGRIRERAYWLWKSREESSVWNPGNEGLEGGRTTSPGRSIYEKHPAETRREVT